MKSALAFCTVVLAIPLTAHAQPYNFPFSITYQGESLTGILIALDLDPNGNASNIDPAQILITHVPANVGISPTPNNPYTFIPHTFEQMHEDPFSHVDTLLTTTTPNIYGFNVTNFQISPIMDLALLDNNQVTLAFNSGGFTTNTAPAYGVSADGERDWFVPTVNSFISFGPATPTPEPTTALLLAATLLPLTKRRHR
ncbi:MAG: hypothetical protein ACTHN5_13590 [Phycisphaerae bacterium]